ncbi:rhomboid family intramembrane serine protease [Aeromicrobium ginsengisoli]|uniref:Rhomboid family intramembrane serine protease n=1 Tax=Aeromicrobium ginsengisoli TaxID=363867 RepID=A0A5M4FBR7_9ACTN|nr:rhomboid family intramembrane serine protease [Aeromicrobium ginsengisoli]KAA1395745.1 rhomboid family intramembrane serine protease [Aeromicrobium ginsengisoli]
MNLPASDYRCYRHPDREAYISCQRCERLICPECMNDASVGFQCPSCIAEGAKSVRAPRTIAGGLVSANAGSVTMVLIAINVLAFVVQIATGDRSSGIYQHGAMQGYVVADGDYWRLLTAAFLHASIPHILFNMMALYVFGPFVERALGTWRYIAAYLTMAVFSSVFVYVINNPFTVTVGASGAIFGLLGIALVVLLRAKQDVRTLLVLLAINAVISTQGNISWEGHLGGFVAGVILGLAFAFAPRDRKLLVQAAVATTMWVGIVVAVVLRTHQLTG